MAKYLMQAPDGSKHEYEADDSWTPEQVEQNFTHDWNLTYGTKKAASPEAERAALDAEVAKERAAGGVVQKADDMVRQFSQNLPIVGEWFDEQRAATSGEDYDTALARDQARRRVIDAENKAETQRTRDTKAALKNRWQNQDRYSQLPSWLPRLPNPMDLFASVPDTQMAAGMESFGDIAKAAGFTAGMTVPGLPVMQGLQQSRPIVEGAVRGGLSGAIYGGAEGAGSANEDKLASGLAGAGVGALVGAPIGALGGRSYKRATTKEVGAKVPGRKEPLSKTRPNETQYDRARRLASDNYKVVDDAGLYINNADRIHTNQSTFGQDLMQRIRSRLQKDMQYDSRSLRGTYRGIPTFVREINQKLRSRTLSLRELEELRRTAGAFSRSGDPSMAGSRKAAALISEEIDNKIDETLAMATSKNGIGNVFLGNASKKSDKQVITALKNARKYTSRAKTAKLLKDAVDQAEIEAAGGQNFTQSVNTKIKSLLKDPVKSKAFSDDQKKYLTQLMEGKISKKALKALGMFDSALGRVFNASTFVYGNEPTSVLGSIAIGVGAKQSKKAVDKITNAATERAIDIVAAGAKKPVLSKAQERIQPLLPGLDRSNKELARRAAQALALDREEEERLRKAREFRKTTGLE